MTDAQIDALVELLDRMDAFPLEFVDGLFSALIAGPETVPVGEWLPLLWPDVLEYRWRDEDEARSGMTQLMALWNHVVWRVNQPVPDVTPELDEDWPGFGLLPFLLAPLEDDDAVGGDGDSQPDISRYFPYGALWAAGFMRGMDQRQAAWERWQAQHEDFAEGLLDIVRLLGTDSERAIAAGFDSDDELTLEDRFAVVLTLPDLLEQMNLQRMQDFRPMPLRKAAEPGRNDPCPCGSGRKYKKCCGDGARSVH